MDVERDSRGWPIGAENWTDAERAEYVALTQADRVTDRRLSFNRVYAQCGASTARGFCCQRRMRGAGHCKHHLTRIDRIGLALRVLRG